MRKETLNIIQPKNDIFFLQILQMREIIKIIFENKKFYLDFRRKVALCLLRTHFEIRVIQKQISNKKA